VSLLSSVGIIFVGVESFLEATSMPRRRFISKVCPNFISRNCQASCERVPVERESLMALPDSREDLIRHYSFSESDLAIIKQHRACLIDWDSLSSFATCVIPASRWRQTKHRLYRCCSSSRDNSDSIQTSGSTTRHEIKRAGNTLSSYKMCSGFSPSR
jgi:hypothetical protein